MQFKVDPTMWEILIFVAVIVERAIQFFVKPFFERYNLDKFWLIPITWVVGGLAAAATGINLFTDVFVWNWVGLIFTAVLVGGGSNFMHEVLEILNGLKGLIRKNGS